MRSLLVVLALFFGISAAHAESSDAVAEFYAGHAALQQGDPSSAIAHFSKALELGNLEDTQVAYVHHYRAIAYQRLDRHQEAIDDYTQALAIGTLPKRVQAAVYYNRAIALDHLSNYDRAIKDYSQAIALKPDYAEAYMNRGNAYRKLSDNDAALRDYESSAAYGNPIKHLPYYGEGLVLEAKGDKQGALKAFQTALLLAPDFEPARTKVESYQASGVTPASGAGTTGATTTAAATRPPATPAAASSTNVAAATPTVKPTPAQTVLPPVGAPASAVSAPAKPTPVSASVTAPKPVTPSTSQVASTSLATPAPTPASSSAAVVTPPATSSAAVTAPKPAATVAASVPAPAQVANTSAASGAFLVQVGAFVSEDLANSQASSIGSKYSDLLSGLTKDIQRADLGAKGVYFRLRYGPFATRNDAMDRCSQLKARGQDCIIVAAPASAG